MDIDLGFFLESIDVAGDVEVEVVVLELLVAGEVRVFIYLLALGVGLQDAGDVLVEGVLVFAGLVAVSFVSFSNNSKPSSPRRLRQRVSDVG